MKKVLCILLSVTIVFSMSTSAFADEIEDNSFCIEDYISYTIDFSSINTDMRSVNDNTVDEALSYVKSLNLSDICYSYIEEACLNERQGYKEDDVILESYTVLVPKVRTKHLYGTYLGSNYYYEYTSMANMRRETKGVEKGKANESKWNSWILGAMDLVIAFRSIKWGVPYSIIRTVTGISSISDVHYGSYNQYVEQFTNTVTRTIFKEKNSASLDACYQDQTSSLRVKLYFCPVGIDETSYYIEIDTVYDGTVQANDLTKNEILQLANSYSNHGGEIIYKVSQHRVKEMW